MSEDEDSGEKPFEATPRKLEEARRRGEFPISQDLTTAGVYLGVLLVFALLGTYSVDKGGAALRVLLDQPDILAERVFAEGGRRALSGLVGSVALAGGLWLALPTLTALAGVAAQQALVFAPEKLKPKASRLSPLSNAKQKFGRDGLFNFAKSFVKLAIYSVVLALIALSRLDDIMISPMLTLPAALLLLADLCWQLLLATFVIMLTISMIDYLWQRAEFLRKQRMSLKELRDEAKETEGDPYTKQARRQRGYEIATTRMMADVPTADVVVVNPEHYAVALKWDRSRGSAPRCVAKGVDEIAARIRRTAIENAVPIFRDPPTARALFATTDIGDEIPVESYKAIAAAIRFADAMRRKARGGSAR
jgi:flagellar biosynthetic protein FlhB